MSALTPFPRPLAAITDLSLATQNVPVALVAAAVNPGGDIPVYLVVDRLGEPHLVNEVRIVDELVQRAAAEAETVIEREQAEREAAA